MRELSLLLLIATARLACVSASCFDDMDACTDDVRGLMTSEDAFWFGNAFHERCVKDGETLTTPDCTNPHTSKTLLGRFFDTDEPDKKLVDTLQMASVVFNAPSGRYYGCGNWTYVEETWNVNVDPTEIMPLNSWSLSFAPSVSWPSISGDDLYTVLIWDVGYFYLHGFYVNAFGSTIENGTPVVPYSGPKNPSPTANTYMVLVIEQTMYLDIEEVGKTLGVVLASNGFQFKPTQLLAAMPGMWTAPVAVNIMNVQGDSYSMEIQKNNYVVNYCPWLVSQEPALQTALNIAEIPVAWARPDQTPPLAAARSMFIISLNVDMTVEYTSDDLVIESCCVKSTTTRTLYRVNPFATWPVRAAVTRNTPRVQLSPTNMLDMRNRITDKMYTLMMVDMTDAVRQSPKQNYNLHWLVVDITKADVMTGKEMKSYFGPNPFNRYEPPRVYVFLLLEQKEKKGEEINLWDYVGNYDCPDFLTGRCGFKVAAMFTEHDLTLVGVTWFLSEQDAYARKMIYERLVVQPMVNVCDGLPGFEFPCPSKIDPYPYPSHATVLLPHLVAPITIALAVLARIF